MTKKTDNYFDNLKTASLAEGIVPGNLSPVELKAALLSKTDNAQQPNKGAPNTVQKPSVAPPTPTTASKPPPPTGHPQAAQKPGAPPAKPSTAPKPMIQAKGPVGTAPIKEEVLDEGLLDWIIKKFKNTNLFRNREEKVLYGKMYKELFRQWYTFVKTQRLDVRNPNGKPTIRDMLKFIGAKVGGEKMIREIAKEIPNIVQRINPNRKADPVVADEHQPADRPWTVISPQIYDLQKSLWTQIINLIDRNEGDGIDHAVEAIEKLIKTAEDAQKRYKDALASHPNNEQNQPYAPHSPEWTEAVRMLTDLRKGSTTENGVETSLKYPEGIVDRIPALKNFEQLMHESRILAFGSYLVESNVYSVRGLVRAHREFFVEATNPQNYLNDEVTTNLAKEFVREIVGMLLLDPGYTIANRHFGFDTPEYHRYMDDMRRHENTYGSSQPPQLPFMDRLRIALENSKVKASEIDEIEKLFHDNHNDIKKVLEDIKSNTDLTHKLTTALYKISSKGGH